MAITGHSRLTVKALAPTDVAKELARSLAPIPKAAMKATGTDKAKIHV